MGELEGSVQTMTSAETQELSVTDAEIMASGPEESVQTVTNAETQESSETDAESMASELTKK